VSEAIKLLWTRERERIDREARERRDSQSALFELFDLYDRLAGEDQKQIDQLMADWVVSDEEDLRFDALALIREKRITTAIPALQTLLVMLLGSRTASAPYEADKVRSIIKSLREEG
jgi:hypothetical protein